MRKTFTTAEAAARGMSRSALAWGKQNGKWVDAGYGVFAEGAEPVTELERSVAAAKACRGQVSGCAAGEMLSLDSVKADRVDFTVEPGACNARPGARRRATLRPPLLVDGVPVTNGTQTVLDLAALLDDLCWEQALESALRRRLTSICDINAALPAMSAARTPGVRRIRRVLAVRPDGAPPTESLLETLAVQLFRAASLPTPVRQFEIRRSNGKLVARVDLAWPELGVFVELDGKQHGEQRLYDASRQTAIIAATGWLCARFTWRQVVRNPTATAREMRAVLRQAEASREARV